MSTPDEIPAQPTFDPLSDEATRNPYAILHRLRELDPVHHEYGMWWVTNHADVAALTDDPENFLNSHPFHKEVLCPAAEELMSRRPQVPPTLTTADAPEHPLNRRPIQKAISARRVRALTPRIEEIARELIAEFHDAGTVDFIPAFAGPFPLYVLAEFIGVPRADFAYFQEMGKTLELSVSTGLDQLPEQEQVRFAEDMLRSDEYLLSLIRARNEAPREDFFSELVAMTRADGRHFTEPELLDIAQMLALGGHETSSNALGAMVLALATHPDLQEDLRRDPEGIDAFVEESLRYSPPVQWRTRRTVRDTEVRGCPVAHDEIFATSIAGANHDPSVFPDPDVFDPSRPNLDQHLSFGRGAHHCLGSEIARAEMRITLALLLGSMNDIRLADPVDGAYEWNRHFLLRGLNSLRLTFTPKQMPGPIVESAR